MLARPAAIFRHHKEKAPRVLRFSGLVCGRGNLNRCSIFLKYMTKVRFDFCLEYLLEYQWQDLNSGALALLMADS